MNRAALIGRVKVKLDELTPFDEGLLVALPNADIKPIEKYINELLDESAMEVLLRVPLHKHTPKRVVATAIPVGGGVGYVDCPADFLKLYSFKMEGWQREVEYPISEGSFHYKLQRNKHTRGGVVKPVVVLNHRGTGGNKQLEYYSLPEGVEHRVEKFLYVPVQMAEELPDSLVVLLEWVCARKVFEALEMKNAEIAETEVQRLLDLENY